MARTCKLIGTALALLGVAGALWFVVIMARDDAYRQAALAASRNPGNVMYDAELKGAQVRRAFEVGVVITGILLTINGLTLLGLGVVAGRVDHA
ncbi:MAG TPA: hypothetical protein VN812_15505 [Candidatus Acidoferrales bacterium]|nr:hypothetical protein [Candidatus Acidoferrales bacterium]